MTNVQEEPRTITGTFNEETVTQRGHLDPDKHWIGEALPAGSDAETRATGTRNSAGVSPFPARADHTHDFATVYTILTGPGLTVPPGRTYMSNLLWYTGRNMLAPGSSQVWVFPDIGVWETLVSFHFSRDGGGYFTGEMNILHTYDNAAFSRYSWRGSTNGIPSNFVKTVVDHAHYGPSIPVRNEQVAIEHNDSVNWTVTTQYIEVRRVAAYGSA